MNRSELDIIVNNNDSNDSDRESVNSQARLSRKRIAQIPDFVALLYAASIIKRKTPLIVEIKPGVVGDRRLQKTAISKMVKQTLLQVRFALEVYNENQTIHVLCVVGMYWGMYSVNRKDLRLLPSKLGDTPMKLETRVFLRGITNNMNVFHLLDETKTRYSDAFKSAWNSFAAQNGLPAAPFI